MFNGIQSSVWCFNHETPVMALIFYRFRHSHRYLHDIKCLTCDLLLITFWVAWSNFVVSDDTCHFFLIFPSIFVYICFSFDLFSSRSSHTTGWSSESDVSINTDPQSELSTGTSATMVPDVRNIDKYYGANYADNLSISQVGFCVCLQNIIAWFTRTEFGVTNHNHKKDKN